MIQSIIQNFIEKLVKTKKKKQSECERLEIERKQTEENQSPEAKMRAIKIERAMKTRIVFQTGQPGALKKMENE